jgi:GTP-binding protein EngB required for normal cell division
VGNPGAGKSCLLNMFLQKAHFKSQISLDLLPITSETQIYPYKGKNYIDTPGLDAMEGREKCAKEIQKALKGTTGRPCIVTVIFVIGTTEGRLQPSDIATINLILDAAEEIRFNFSLVVNKLEPILHESFKNNSENIIARLNKGLKYSTKSVYFMPLKPELVGNTGTVIPPYDAEFREFVLRAPMVEITPEKVMEIRHETYDEMKKKFDQMLDDLKQQQVKDKNAFEETMKLERERNERQYQEMLREQRELERNHSEQISNLTNAITQALQKREERDDSILRLFGYKIL